MPESLLLEFDSDLNAIIEPVNTVTKVPDFPDVCISTFTPSLFDGFTENAPIIAHVQTIAGVYPIYEIDYKGRRVALYITRLGAPAAAASFEECIAMGLKKMLLYGCCGVLDQSIPAGHILLPTASLRDEGTSHHYLPASEEIELDPKGVETLRKTMADLQIPYVTGKNWTTDALYRETAGKMQRRKAAGCISVDMECAAMAAVAQFRHVFFAQFFYSADNLDAPAWEHRGIADIGLTHQNKYTVLALECALRL